MKTVLTSLALAAVLCACNDRNDAAPAPAPAEPSATPAANPADDQTDDQVPVDQDGDDAAQVDVPERYRGEWAATVEACDRPGDVSLLAIDRDSIRFHESEGPIVSLVERGNELTLLARLTGEGETRDASYTFRISADGNTLTDLNGFARQRCD